MLPKYTFAILLLVDHMLEVKLEGAAGGRYDRGRVVVRNAHQYNQTWGTICDDGWDDADAGVVCRRLGYNKLVFINERCYMMQALISHWWLSIACTQWPGCYMKCQPALKCGFQLEPDFLKKHAAFWWDGPWTELSMYMYYAYTRELWLSQERR